MNCVSGVGGANLKKRIEYIMIHPMALNLNPAWKALLALAGIAAIALPMMFGILNAQTAPRAQFEVASIKKNIDGTGVSFGPVPGGRLIAVNNPAMNFITNAYSVRPYQVVNAPEWLRTDRYDIEAKTDATITGAQMMPMLQVLLENRFKLKVHRETREMPVFYLTAANSGIKLKPSTTKCIQFNPNEPPRPRNLEGTLPVCNNLLSGNGQNMRWRAQNIDMAQMTGALSSVLGRHVIDKTGFTGRFDLNLEFSRDPTPADDATTAPSIITLLQGELGLKLDSGRSPVEVFVIDHIERPSENWPSRSRSVNGCLFAHASECIFVVALAIVDFAEKQIPFRVGSDAMDVKKLSCVVTGMSANRRDNLQRLPVQDSNRFV